MGKPHPKGLGQRVGGRAPQMEIEELLAPEAAAKDARRTKAEDAHYLAVFSSLSRSKGPSWQTCVPLAHFS